ncbi:MAG: pro-sigmaK processing inhibitor BofA family protein [Candidatus Marsarchaeota archaeon]|nr:pro-sigmaK processing inhibitor BofA family protein [Candidatus Marsarchaeota archaeon]
MVLVSAANSTAQQVTSVLSASSITTIIIAVILIVIAVLIIVKLKKFVINTILGLAVLLILNFFGFTLPLDFINIIITAVLGLLGVGLLIILKILGVVL